MLWRTVTSKAYLEVRTCAVNSWLSLRGVVRDAIGSVGAVRYLLASTSPPMHLHLTTSPKFCLSRSLCSTRCWLRFRKPFSSCYKPARHFQTPTALLTRPQTGLNIPGIGDISNLKVDLSDVPDGRYREVEVQCHATIYLTPYKQASPRILCSICSVCRQCHT